MPDALFARRIRMRIVRTENLAVRSADLMLTASLFAVVAIFVERESVVAGTHVRTDRITAFLLASAVVHCTLIFI